MSSSTTDPKSPNANRAVGMRLSGWNPGTMLSLNLAGAQYRRAASAGRCGNVRARGWIDCKPASGALERRRLRLQVIRVLAH
jgi:hypothetical protein